MTGEPKVMTQEARYGVRLNYVIFPIDFRELRHALARNGYELSPPIRGHLPPPPARIGFGGDFARKGETTVQVETDSGEIRVVGRSLQKTKVAFEELEKILKAELRRNLHENVKYYECVVHYKVDTGKIPRDQIVKAENEEYIKRFGQVLGENLSTFSIRFGPKDAVPNSDSWFDIAIEPDIIDAKLYHVGVVFRSPDRGRTETFVRNLENNLLKLIGIIEV